MVETVAKMLSATMIRKMRPAASLRGRDGVLRLARTEDPGSGYRPTKEVETPAGGGGGSSGCVDPPLV